jgi:hypothetical protein
MSEITVRRVGGQIVMMLINETNPKVQVTLDADEAARLAALLLQTRAEVEADEGVPTRLLNLDPATIRANARPFQAI